MVASHVCTGAECPVCGVFARPAPRSKVHTFRDSRGLTVPRMPDAQGIGTSLIIVPRDEYPIINKIVVHQRRDNLHWGLPGGRWETGESVLEAAVREAKEETGLTIEIQRLVCVDSDPTAHAICAYPGDVYIHYCALTFLATADDRLPLVLSEESLSLTWTTVYRLPEPFLLSHRWRVEEAVVFRSEVTVR